MKSIYTEAFLKEHQYHRMLGTKCDMLVSLADGDRIVKSLLEIVRAHTLPELQMKCDVAGLRKTGTKFQMGLALYKAGVIQEKEALSAEEEVAFRIEVQAMVRKHTLVQLRELCDVACVSSVGNKLGLATRLKRPFYTNGTTF